MVPLSTPGFDSVTAITVFLHVTKTPASYALVGVAITQQGETV